MRWLNDCLNSILFLGHLNLLCSITFQSIAEINFHLFPWVLLLILFVLTRCTLWVGSHVSCSQCVPGCTLWVGSHVSCPRKLFVFISLLFWLLLCFFCTPFFLCFINCFIWSSHIFYTFFSFVFRIFVCCWFQCFVSFPILFRYRLCFVFLYIV
jgi:hypothetical protein